MGRALLDFIKREPVAVAFTIDVLLRAAVQFGAPLSPAQITALDVVAAAILTIVTRQQVTPVRSVSARE